MINELKTIRESLNNAKIDNGDRVRESDYRMRRYYEQREAACINALSALDRIEAQLAQPTTKLTPEQVEKVMSVAWPWFTRFDPNDDSTCDDYINNKPEGHEPER